MENGAGRPPRRAPGYHRRDPMTLASGTKLGPYEILAPIGAGGMGEVYRARDARLGRNVALKVLPERLSTDRERLSRFEKEARSASALNHPNVVTIYEVGQAGGISYIAMELVEGQTLRELIAAGPLPQRKVLEFGAQVAEGLAKAHASGVVHRDLKPENLMVSEDGFVKIVDFGLAKLVEPSPEDLSNFATAGASQTGRGVVLGTVAYMSPEQASGRPVDFRSDQFALASVLYEMAIGSQAFRRETFAETLTAIIREEPESIALLNARLPAPLCWIIKRCLAKDPRERYASSHDLARDLAEVRDRFLEAPREARESRPTSLPVQRTGFVGRVKERAAVRQLLLRPDAYLVTLTGPGGIGKTRLGLEVAGEMADSFPGGIHFVALAPLNEADLIASTICQALGVREAPEKPPIATLKEHLRDSLAAPMLLMLDSFEHLIAAASLVADVVAAGKKLKVLVTSRSPLHIYGEQEFPVPPLGLPDPASGAGERPSGDAISLFANRAASVMPDFEVTEENAVAIAEICARLDGLPLAIELAAARVKLLSPAAMRTRLEKRLQLLTGGARDLPRRQQTLRGAIDWSYDLLGPAEQKLFRRLAVFVGGCTLEAAEAVCDSKGDLGLDILDGIESLMNKSLIQRIEPPGGEPRFVLLETIREYGLERLGSSSEESPTRRAHAAYCVVLAEDEASERAKKPGVPRGPSPGHEGSGWLDRLELEHDNFRAALDWLIENGRSGLGSSARRRAVSVLGGARVPDSGPGKAGKAPEPPRRGRALTAASAGALRRGRLDRGAGGVTSVPRRGAEDQPRARRSERRRGRAERVGGRSAGGEGPRPLAVSPGREPRPVERAGRPRRRGPGTLQPRQRRPARTAVRRGALTLRRVLVDLPAARRPGRNGLDARRRGGRRA